MFKFLVHRVILSSIFVMSKTSQYDLRCISSKQCRPNRLNDYEVMKAMSYFMQSPGKKNCFTFCKDDRRNYFVWFSKVL